LGSYYQITNNIKYSNNPDIGTSSPPSMGGALYEKRSTGSNYVNVLPEVPVTNKPRIGYFETDIRLDTSLPYYTDNRTPA